MKNEMTLQKSQVTSKMLSDMILPSPADKPDIHGFLILGQKTIFLSHFMMFPMKDHRYQVVLKAELDEEGLATYLKERNDPTDPTKLLVLANQEDFLMTLPQLLSKQITEVPYDMSIGFPPSGHSTLIHSGTLKITDVVIFRPLDYFSETSVYPPALTYYIFGSGDEAHLSHYVSKFPNFQHDLTLKSVPEGISQEDLEHGQLISIPELYLSPYVPLPDDEPLAENDYQVMVRGKQGLHTVELGPTWWYSTDEINGSGDEY